MLVSKGSEEVELPLTAVEAEVMELKVIEELLLSLHAATRCYVRESTVLSTSAGAAPIRTNLKATYFVL